MDTSIPTVDDENPFAANLAKAIERVGNRNECQFVATDIRTGEIVDHDASEDTLMERIQNRYLPLNEMCFISVIQGVAEIRRSE